jgi:hypothetical protein
MKRTWWGLCLLLILLLSIQVNAQNEPVVITWFIGLGVASSEGMVEFEKKLIEEFNASQTEIRIELMCGCGGGTPSDALITAIVSGNAPDIVGPINPVSASDFHEYWLDLQPLVDKTGYDLSQFPPNLVDIHRSPQGLTSCSYHASQADRTEQGLIGIRGLCKCGSGRGIVKFNGYIDCLIVPGGHTRYAHNSFVECLTFTDEVTLFRR